MRLLLADDHELVRDTLVMFLEGQEDFVVSTAGTFDEACAMILADDPYDLVLLDLNMPGMNGLAGLHTAMGLRGGQSVALLSGQAPQAIVQEALAAGAAGFIPKSMSATSLVNAVRFMQKGEQFAPIDVMGQGGAVARNPLLSQLTRRELQVLRGLTEGKSNKEIGRDLDIQEPTVKLHVKTLYRKIGVSNRTQAAMVAREAGIY